MYKMDFWTDLNSGADWGLDLLSQANGLFGDLKDASHLKGDSDPACKPGDAVEKMACSPESDGPFDFEWMESGDLGSFLDALDNGQERLSVQDSLFDCSQEFSLKDNASVSHEQTKLFSNVTSGDYFDQGLTPPDSPEQVTPIIKLDPEVNEQYLVLNTQNLPESVPSQGYTISIEECDSISEPSPVLIQAPVDILDDQIDLKPELFGAADIFGLSFVPDSVQSSELADSADGTSYLSSDEASINPSPSASPSPRPSIDSLIQSSPELYKVIATPSSRFSPYSKSKSDHKTKDGSKPQKSKIKTEKLTSEIIPEDFFPSNLGKKERKKLQNKNAAIRYRQKKKAEVEVIASEVQGLEDRNEELKTKVDDLQREVRYMKSLMEDIYKAKGLVK